MIISLKQNGNPAENTRRLQQALDEGGTICVEQPGIYDFEGHLTIGDNTALVCGAGVFFRRVEKVSGPIPPFLYNKGLEQNTFNHGIRIEGLHLITNGVDMISIADIGDAGQLFPGMRGHLGFAGVRNLTVRGYEVHDLSEVCYGIQIVNFENILLENLFIEGRKDGVHLGRGSKFTIRHCKFRTYDDPIALNAYDYCLSNYQFGWLEDGLIEDCYDLDDKDTTGFFCRLLGGSWCNWYQGMEVQNSTLAVHNGILYSASVTPITLRKEALHSMVPPTHTKGFCEYADGVKWRVVQPHDGQYDAGCRRITFRNIYLQKRRIVAFAFEMCTPPWAISVPRGLPLPPQEDIVFDTIFCGNMVDYLLMLDGSVRNIHISNSTVGRNLLAAHMLPDQEEAYFPSDITVFGTTFKHGGELVSGENSSYIRLSLYGCRVADGGDLTSSGGAKVDADNLRIVEKTITD